ncbi:hypothetical protein HUG10_04120 [Halorarum halophilum]|uniref:Uncharacterized protein n=1 Tax=Halorarum halophilum TaxID=2743090 RepID=A0A7D5KWJ9_9EURY|nr:hypothetical protein [Halobaculum halophilum]QLG26778.1 hypothetical protein HUG10_04120 [Halobaculum halophilum]
MANTPRRWVLALALVMVTAPAAGPLVAAQEGEDRSEPPGVTDGELDSSTSLLRAHTSALLADGFSANGSANVTVYRRGVLVDVHRTANRSVVVDGAEYRQSQQTDAKATVGSATRGTEFWGNDSVEARQRVENGRTSYETGEGKSNGSLSAAFLMRPYLRSATYTVTDTGTANGSSSSGEPIGGEMRYTLTATELENATHIETQLPNGASDPRNFSATVVVDEDGRIHEFDATLDYTIKGSDRTHTISFDLQELGVSSVSRPSWVGEALGETGTTTGT